MKAITTIGVAAKRVILWALGLFIVFTVYETLLPNIWRRNHILLSLILLWAFTAHFVLPRIVRILAKYFTPRYFIGRTMTADGLLGDPVNLAINGTASELRKAMKQAGWELADPITLKSSWRMARSTVLRKSYPKAPVSDLYLFGRKQDLAFQHEVDGNPRKRHHVRFWKSPRGWYMPGGHKVNWLGAATYDNAVGVSYFTLQITHRIDANIDAERDYLVGTLRRANKRIKSTFIKHFFPPYKTRNGGGDHIVTDGSLIIVDLH